MPIIKSRILDQKTFDIISLSRQTNPTLTRREISEKTGVCVKTVYNYQKKYGVL